MQKIRKRVRSMRVRGLRHAARNTEEVKADIGLFPRATTRNCRCGSESKWPLCTASNRYSHSGKCKFGAEANDALRSTDTLEKNRRRKRILSQTTDIPNITLHTNRIIVKLNDSIKSLRSTVCDCTPVSLTMQNCGEMLCWF